MDSAEVSSTEADALAQRLGLQFIRVSTKEKFNVDKVFEYLAKTWLAMGRDAHEGEAAAAIEAPGRPPRAAGKEGFAEAPKVCQYTLFPCVHITMHNHAGVPGSALRR